MSIASLSNTHYVILRDFLRVLRKSRFTRFTCAFAFKKSGIAFGFYEAHVLRILRDLRNFYVIYVIFT